MALNFYPYSANPTAFNVHAVHAGDSLEMESRFNNALAAAVAASEVNLVDVQIGGAASGYDWEGWFITTSLSVPAALALGFVAVPLAGTSIVAAEGGDPQECVVRLRNRLAASSNTSVNKIVLAGAGDGPRYMAIGFGTTEAVPLPPAPPLSTFGGFFALMPGDNAATVAVGAAVEFPQDGAANGIVRSSASQFVLPATGTYKVTWQVSVDEAGQLMLDLNGSIATTAATVAGRATGTSQISNSVLIAATAADVLRVINPTGNAAALTITPLAGGTHAVSAWLLIERVA
jgi:hypothetical protein